MSVIAGISVQINLAPPDYPLARFLLPHQIRILSPYAREIVLTLETRPGKGRFAEGWAKNLGLIERLIDDVAQVHPGVVKLPIQYDTKSRDTVREKLGAPWPIPHRDFRGGPFYSYLYGLASTRSDVILHIDSDIIFGGNPLGWFEEATARLAAAPNVVAVAPLAGPPTVDGSLRQDRSVSEDRTRREYIFDCMSTRIFMTTRRKFRILLDGGLVPRPRDIATALVDGNPLARLPESIFSSTMRRRGLSRIDMAGPGVFWSLHPPYKSAKFIEKLPSILSDIDRDQIPDDQRGCYDLNAGFFDFQEEHAALAKRRWWMRLQKRLKILSRAG